ncbi:NAD(P)-dependent oxidoreductase [Planctomycetota bacterium]
MKVIAHDPTVNQNIPDGINMVNLEELFKTSDVITLHCPLTDQTRGLINQQNLALMKKSAFLINTSRGLLMDETALAEALNSGQIAAAALDVLAVEPPPPRKPRIGRRSTWCFRRGSLS